jgi:hypothetical protein
LLLVPFNLDLLLVGQRLALPSEAAGLLASLLCRDESIVVGIHVLEEVRR